MWIEMNPTKIKLLGIVGILILLLCCLFFKSPQIEADLSSRTFEALKNKGITVSGLTVDGRDVTLEGFVESDKIRKKAGEIAGKVYGVNKVINNLKVVHSQPEVEKSGKIEKLQETLTGFSAENIEFETGSSVIRKTSYPVLNKLVQLLKKYPGVKIEIGGHTDSKGNAEFNLNLSQRRADAVKKYLVEQGIDAGRLVAKGYGSSKPVADNKTPEGRRKNRRVEFKIQKEK